MTLQDPLCVHSGSRLPSFFCCMLPFVIFCLISSFTCCRCITASTARTACTASTAKFNCYRTAAQDHSGHSSSFLSCLQVDDAEYSKYWKAPAAPAAPPESLAGGKYRHQWFQMPDKVRLPALVLLTGLLFCLPWSLSLI
jgi:hypothetical protein